MNTTKTKLAEAIRLLEEVHATLDDQSAVCGNCGLTVKHNFKESQDAALLASAVLKARRVLGHLA